MDDYEYSWEKALFVFIFLIVAILLPPCRMAIWILLPLGSGPDDFMFLLLFLILFVAIAIYAGTARPGKSLNDIQRQFTIQFLMKKKSKRKIKAKRSTHFPLPGDDIDNEAEVIPQEEDMYFTEEDNNW